MDVHRYARHEAGCLIVQPPHNSSQPCQEYSHTWCSTLVQGDSGEVMGVLTRASVVRALEQMDE